MKIFGIIASLFGAAAPAAEVKTENTKSLHFGLLFLGKEDLTLVDRIGEIATRERARLQSEIHRDCSGLKIATTVVSSRQQMLPEKRVFELIAKGVTPEMTAHVYQSQAAIGVTAESSSGDLKLLNLWAARVLGAAAETGNCLIQDGESRQFLSADYWRRLRIETWTGAEPDVYSQISIHLYRNPELVRAVTLGMSKFGRPELTIDSFPSSHSDPVTNLITAIGQYIVETTYDEGIASFAISSLKNPAAKSRLASCFAAGENARFEYLTRRVEPEDGDARNDLAKIDFDLPQVSEYQQRITATLLRYFKTEQELKYAKGNDVELLAARDEARVRFLTKKELFEKGLKPTERILVKAPFVFEDSTEYKWLEVIEWKGDRLTGVLLSPSARNPELKPGQRIEILVTTIFDYLHETDGGEAEGNETGKILERRGK